MKKDTDMEMVTDMDTDTGHRVLNISRLRQFFKDSDVGHWISVEL